ncbi:MAG: hypothetical protein ACK50J_21030, partial [Planctomyces sp.]
GMLIKQTDVPLRTHVLTAAAATVRPFAQCLFTLTFLPYEASISLDAILRTLIRVHWTRSRLLEWKTFSDTNQSVRSDMRGFFREMMAAPAVSLFTSVTLLLTNPSSLMIAAPLLLLWIASPAIAWWLSRPILTKPTDLKPEQLQFLRKCSRKTWRYFETFVTEEDNWLPPDNVQMNPDEVVAHRTSPTNIGIALLADLAAHDFGYISVGCLLDRTQKTFGTMNRMERYRGHLFNWYDTRTLIPLAPRYVSTVDSGNLAGQLLVLGSGMRQMLDEDLLSSHLCCGMS